MSNGRSVVGMVLAMAVVLLISCAPKVAPTPAPQTPVPMATPAPAALRPSVMPAVPAKPAWQEKWDNIVAAAKQEGKVVIHTTGSAGERNAIVQGMKEVFRIGAEVIIGRGAMLAPKFQAEQKAGLYLNDIWLGGYTVIPLQTKQTGMMEYPLDSQLILPDVTDPETIKKVWYEGKFPWVDKDHSLFITTLQPRPPLAVNTNLVKEGDIKSYRDMLNPKWKGKLVVNDPTIAGAGQNILGAALALVGEDFIRELAKAEPIVMRDQRLALDWLAQGKIAIVFAPDNDTLIEFDKAGAPIKDVTPVEGGYVSAAASGVALFKNASHANAAKVFINWITSKEGQEIYVRAGQLHSLRLDISIAHLRRQQMRQTGTKYYDASTEEASIVRLAETQKLARELFGPLSR